MHTAGSAEPLETVSLRLWLCPRSDLSQALHRALETEEVLTVCEGEAESFFACFSFFNAFIYVCVYFY